MRKKSLMVAFSLVLALGMTACGNKESGKNTTEGTTAEAVKTEENTTEDATASEDTATSEDTVASEDSSTDDAAGDTATPDAVPGDDIATNVEQTQTITILQKTWNLFADDQKFFVMGGDMEANVSDGPGNFGLADTESLEYMLYFPADKVEMIDEAASLTHAMNANTFTSGAFHLKDEANVKTIADSIKDKIDSTQWMCGFPDKALIASVDGCVVSAFGNADNMNNFKSKLKEAYPDVTIIHDYDIVIE